MGPRSGAARSRLGPGGEVLGVTERHTDTPLGTMRSRAVGEPVIGVPEVVLVQGLAVSDYLLPGLAALGRWTRAHLVDVPGLAGSGDPPHELDVPEMGSAVAHWLRRRAEAGVVLAGHSSGTQVAAHAAHSVRGTGLVRALVLAAPTIDPVARGWLRVLVRWLQDGRQEPPGLTAVHWPEWRRAGVRRLLHIVRVHLADDLEVTLRDIDVPLLVLRGTEDRLSTEGWARHLAGLAADGELVPMPGAHTFPWLEPDAWSGPVHRLARRVADQGR